MSNFKKRKLDNEVPVLMVSYPDGQTVTIGVTYNVGGRNEWDDKSLDGISHFLEHQFFKGNENLTPIEVNQKLDELGGITNAFTTEDTTCYFTKCLNSEIDDAIDLWNELLTYGPIDQEEFEKESFVVRQEFRRLEDNPPNLLYKNLKKTLFAGTSLEMDVIGSEESLEAVTLEQMEEYREEHYGLENSALMVLGNFDEDRVYRKLNETFGQRNIGNEPPNYDLTEYVPSSKTELRKIHLEKDTPLTFYGMALPTPGGKSEDKYAVDLLMAYLTLGKSSLLKERLVRSGLCAFAFSFTQTHEDVGCLVFVAGTPPNQFSKAHEATMKMLYDALTMDVTEEMLEDIIKRIEYDIRGTYEEPMMMLFTQATGYWRSGEFQSLDEYMDKLRNVSLDEFKEVREKVLGNLDGVYGTIGSEAPDISIPEDTWENGTVVPGKIPEW